jgi:hypothetical protein
MPDVLSANAESIPIEGNRLQLTFTPNPGKLIYCNYPEVLLTNEVLGDKQYGNHYLNKAEVKVNEDCQLFASHSNRTGLNMKYGIQFYNGGQSEVTLKISNAGYSAQQDWDTASLEVWNNFFQSTEVSYLIPPGGVKWILEQNVPPGYLINAVSRFSANGDLDCFEYLYLDLNSIDGTATLYPWDNGESKMYRGTGDSYFITTNVELNVSQLPCMIMTNTRECHNANELIEIVEPSNGTIFSIGNGANLGNWGIQYGFTVKVINDTESPQTVKAYVGTEQGNPGVQGGPRILSVINYGGKVVSCCSETNQSWNWLKEDPPIPSGQPMEHQYQYIHASNSCGASVHIWRLDDQPQ